MTNVKKVSTCMNLNVKIANVILMAVFLQDAMKMVNVIVKMAGMDKNVNVKVPYHVF